VHRPVLLPRGVFAWAVEGPIVREAVDAGVSGLPPRYQLEVAEVFNFSSISPPKVGDRLPINRADEGFRMMLLSDGETSFLSSDAGVMCQFDQFPRDAWLEALRTNTCPALLVDAGVPLDPVCNDYRCGCSAMPAAAGLWLLGLAHALRRRRPR
jgi:MYXO-CTERM domain-containing protein